MQDVRLHMQIIEVELSVALESVNYINRQLFTFLNFLYFRQEISKYEKYCRGEEQWLLWKGDGALFNAFCYQ